MTIAVDALHHGRELEGARTSARTLRIPAVRGWGWSLAARATIIYSIPLFLGHLQLPLPHGVLALIRTIWESGDAFFKQHIMLIDPATVRFDSFEVTRAH